MTGGPFRSTMQKKGGPSRSAERTISMKVLLVNGSARASGNTALALEEAAKQLREEDPELSAPGDRPVLERVRQLFAATPDIFN